MGVMLNQIRELLYDGVLDAAAWHQGLDQLRVVTESALFHHAVWDSHVQGITASLSNDSVSPEKLREFDEHHAPYDPRIPRIMAAGVGGIMLDHEHFSDREMSRSPIYADWLASLGYRHTVGMVLRDDGETQDLLALLRPLDHHHFDEQTQTRMRQLMPDLLRASNLRARAARVARPSALGALALEHLPQAVAVLDANRRIQHMNVAARKSLSTPSAHGIHVQGGFLRLHDDEAHALLIGAVQSACQPRSRDGLPPARTGSLLSTRQRKGLAISVLPLKNEHVLATDVSGTAQHLAMLLWAGPEPCMPEPADLARLLGVTPAEARIALALAQGMSLKEFASHQACSWHTARSHLRNLMIKTGTSRQAEVVTLVRSLLA